MDKNYEGIDIYHYTDFIALDGILNGYGLRLCDVRFMNDSSEMKQFLTMLQNAINYKLAKVDKSDLIENVNKLFNEETEKRKNATMYVLCFSKYVDDAAQWERYGNGGNGVCIGFNAKILKQITYKQVRLQEIFYEKDVKDHEHVQIIIDYILDPSKPIKGFCSIEGVFDNVWACSGAFKHPSFASEKEIRLITIPIENRNILGRPFFLLERGKIKKYHSINIKQLCEANEININKLITSITIGPKSTQSIEILKEFLIEKELGDLTNAIYKSNCPLS